MTNQYTTSYAIYNINRHINELAYEAHHSLMIRTSRAQHNITRQYLQALTELRITRRNQRSIDILLGISIDPAQTQ